MCSLVITRNFCAECTASLGLPVMFGRNANRNFSIFIMYIVCTCTCMLCTTHAYTVCIKKVPHLVRSIQSLCCSIVSWLSFHCHFILVRFVPFNFIHNIPFCTEVPEVLPSRAAAIFVLQRSKPQRENFVNHGLPGYGHSAIAGNSSQAMLGN